MVTLWNKLYSQWITDASRNSVTEFKASAMRKWENGNYTLFKNSLPRF
jgi:hypothetical protein